MQYERFWKINVSILDQIEDFTISSKSLLLSACSQALSSWAVEGCVLRFRRTYPRYPTAWMRCRFFLLLYLSKHVEFHTLLWWTEYRAIHFVSFLIILRNNCTDNSISKVHLLTKFKLRAKWNTLASVSTQKREGVTSPIRQISYTYVVFGLFFLFEVMLVLW